MRDTQQAYCVMSHTYTRISSFENSLAKLQNCVPEICHFVLCIFYLECEERKFSTVSLRYYVSVSTEKEYIMCQELEETHPSLLCD